MKNLFYFSKIYYFFPYFKLKSDTNHYVLRIPPKNSQAIINRTKEKHIEKSAYGGISAKCLYFDSKTGIKITEFINGSKLHRYKKTF